MTDPHEITGLVEVSPGHLRRFRIGQDSGALFQDGDYYDGVTLIVEALSMEDGRAILRLLKWAEFRDDDYPEWLADQGVV